MGYKIWRKDSQGWDLVFDQVFETKEKAEERILELNAIYHQLIQYGELSFYSYPEDIKISKSGDIIDSVLLEKQSRKNNARKKWKNKFKDNAKKMKRFLNTQEELPPTPRTKNE